MPRYDDYNKSPNPKRFHRSRDDKIIAGICGGLAERFGWEPILVRALALILLFTVGFVFPVYLVMWVITSKAPYSRGAITPEEDAFWRGVSDRPNVTFGNLKYTFMDLEDRLQTLERNVTSDDWRLRKEFRDLERQ